MFSMFIQWTIIFIIALIALVQGAKILIDASERIGASFRLSPFVIGVLIVGVGTSLPEFVAGLAAALSGVGSIVASNAIGSNIANIFLVLGLTAVIGGRLTATQDLIGTDLPLFIVSTVLFFGTVSDGIITFVEAILLSVAYLVYLRYSLTTNKSSYPEVEEMVADEWGRKKIKRREWLKFIAGLGAVVLGARFLVESVVTLSDMLGIVPGLISITAIALGTSLPELFVSLQAMKLGKSDIAIGNIFGSNAFNILMAVGIPGLITKITLDEPTFYIGLPALAAATFIFLITGISKKIFRWEGVMFLLLYVLFILKLLNLA
jgi:cation:H+ antiporter